MRLPLGFFLGVLSRFAFWNLVCVFAAPLWGKLDEVATRRLIYGVYRSTNAKIRKRAVADDLKSYSLNQFQDQRLFDLVCASRKLDKIQAFVDMARKYGITNSMFDLYDACRDGTIGRRIKESILSRHTDNRPMVLLTITADVLSYAERWIGLYKLSVDPRVFTLVFLCLDKKSEYFVKLHSGVAICLSNLLPAEMDKADGYKRQAIWIIRVHVLRELIRLGFDVLNCDIDAFIVGDIACLLKGGNQEIAFQRDFSIPLDLSRKYGFIACPGFSFYRSTPAVQRFLDLFAAEVLFVRDDQIAANVLLLGHSPILMDEDAGTVLISQGVSCRLFWGSDVSRQPTEGRYVRHFGPRYFDPAHVENILNQLEQMVRGEE